MSDDKMTQQDLASIFGEEIPMEAVQLLFSAPDHMPVPVLREKLNDLARKYKRAPNEIEVVYGYLLNRYIKAVRDGDKELSEEIFAATRTYQKIWPEDTARWEARMDAKKGQ
ncbi:hypothetical protein [Aquamicrobium sp.]|uniref:hypothetical protein n=1 Tax=Aquamicrobium sp. TaxID=1872579 RepID=UPI00258DC661|nr:hypothetical protein [Aquamicrobium sp.]MCK9549159.1 hypothetical protein [Aquamicrobium sp.]